MSCNLSGRRNFSHYKIRCAPVKRIAPRFSYLTHHKRRLWSHDRRRRRRENRRVAETVASGTKPHGTFSDVNKLVCSLPTRERCHLLLAWGHPQENLGSVRSGRLDFAHSIVRLHCTRCALVKRIGVLSPIAQLICTR